MKIASTAASATVLLTVLVVASADFMADCEDSPEGMCSREPDQPQEGALLRMGMEDGSPGYGAPGRFHTPVVVVLSPSEQTTVRQKLQTIKDVMPEFFDSMVASTDDILSMNYRLAQVNRDECGALEGFTTLWETSVSWWNEPNKETCEEGCYTYTPMYIKHQGSWVPVVHWPRHFSQSLRMCNCSNDYCTGQSSCGWWWRGKCIPAKTTRKLLVVVRKQTGGIKFKWVKRKITVGCSCVPWGYGMN